MDAAPAMTRLWASAELARRAQRLADGYVVPPGPNRVGSLRELTRMMLLDHILAELLLKVVTDEEFDRIRDELRALL